MQIIFVFKIINFYYKCLQCNLTFMIISGFKKNKDSILGIQIDMNLYKMDQVMKSKFCTLLNIYSIFFIVIKICKLLRLIAILY